MGRVEDIDEDYEIYQPTVYIYELQLEPETTGKGLGSLMMKKLEEEIITQSLPKFLIQCFINSHSLSLILFYVLANHFIHIVFHSFPIIGQQSHTSLLLEK